MLKLKKRHIPYFTDVRNCVSVESDQPLQSIFQIPLYQASARLQSLLLSIQRYDIEVVYKPSKTMFIADILCRNFINETKEQIIPDIKDYMYSISY